MKPHHNPLHLHFYLDRHQISPTHRSHSPEYVGFLKLIFIKTRELFPGKYQERRKKSIPGSATLSGSKSTCHGFLRGPRSILPTSSVEICSGAFTMWIFSPIRNTLPADDIYFIFQSVSLFSVLKTFRIWADPVTVMQGGSRKCPRHWLRLMQWPLSSPLTGTAAVAVETCQRPSLLCDGWRWRSGTSGEQGRKTSTGTRPVSWIVDKESAAADVLEKIRRMFYTNHTRLTSRFVDFKLQLLPGVYFLINFIESFRVSGETPDAGMLELQTTFRF